MAGADLGGLAIGAVISAIFVARIDRRYMAVGAALFTIAANALCIVYQSYDAMVWLRLAAGIGYNGVFIMCASASIAAMLVYLYMYVRLKKTIPVLADAS